MRYSRKVRFLIIFLLRSPCFGMVLGDISSVNLFWATILESALRMSGELVLLFCLQFGPFGSRFGRWLSSELERAPPFLGFAFRQVDD